MPKRKKFYNKVGLVVLVFAMVISGYYLYIRGLAATESISVDGCNKLVAEKQWHIDGAKCEGQNGVVLTITP